MKFKSMIVFLLMAAAVLCLLQASSFAMEIPWFLGEMDSGVIDLTEDSVNAVLTEYAYIVGKLQEEQAERSTGRIHDFDGDGYPELILLYERENVDTEYPTYEAKFVCHASEGQLDYLNCRLGMNWGNPFSTVYLSIEDGKPLIHFVYQNQNFRTPPTVFTADFVAFYGDGELTVPYILKSQQKMGTTELVLEVNGKEDPAEFKRVWGEIKETICDDSDSFYNNTTLSDLQYQILHYTDAKK